MPNYLALLISLTIISLPTYLVRFSIFSIPTNLFEVLAIITILAIFFYKKRNSLLEISKQNSAIAIAALLILLGLTIATFENNTAAKSLGIIKSWFVIPMFFSFLLATLPQRDFAKTLILRCLFASILLVATISITYAFFGVFTYDGRLKSFFLSPNHLAMFVAPGIFVGIYLMHKARNNQTILQYSLLVSSLALIMTALFLTKSYSAWIAVVFAYPILMLFSKSGLFRYLGRVGIFIFIFSLLLSTQIGTEKFLAATHISERSSLASRVMIWKSAVKIIGDNPLWGIGPGMFQEKYLAYQKYFPPYLEWAVPQPHNLYFAFWLQAGIFGLFGFFLLIISAFRKIETLAKNKKTAPLAVLIAVYLTSVLIWGIADTPYWKNDLAFVFWLMLSLMFQSTCSHGKMVTSL